MLRCAILLQECTSMPTKLILKGDGWATLYKCICYGKNHRSNTRNVSLLTQPTPVLFEYTISRSLFCRRNFRKDLLIRLRRPKWMLLGLSVSPEGLYCLRPTNVIFGGHKNRLQSNNQSREGYLPRALQGSNQRQLIPGTDTAWSAWRR